MPPSSAAIETPRKPCSPNLFQTFRSTCPWVEQVYFLEGYGVTKIESLSKKLVFCHLWSKMGSLQGEISGFPLGFSIDEFLDFWSREFRAILEFDKFLHFLLLLHTPILKKCQFHCKDHDLFKVDKFEHFLCLENLQISKVSKVSKF